MSRTIDERVVEMRFDNRHFEKNVSTTMSSLEKLKQSLNLKNSSKSLENLNTAAKGVNLSPLSSAVDAVSSRFSALEVMGVTALANITNSAVNAGKRIVSSLTIDPVKTGFQEYETQINSVQTILANTESKGSTLKDVTAALDELNKYADKTIYNFTEMTRNIGTFTAAGVDLDTSVSAIKGIANLAAVSGSTSQQASTAMYQLSQALASGTVKLMDWNSVVNAGMGGQVFQDALKETARVHGIAIDKMIEQEGSFRETLSKGWLTSDILTETLAKFTGDLSEEQLKSIGYTDEQVKSIMKLGQTANDAATKVKTFTQLFDTLKEAAQSGWTQTWSTILGDFEEAKELFTELSDGLGGIINRSAESRNNLISGAFDSNWKQLEEKITSAGLASEDFQNGLIKTAKTHGIEIDKMIKKEGSFENTLKNGWLTSGIINETLNSFIGAEKEVGDATKTINTNLEELQSIANKVINGEFGSGEARIKALTKAGYDYATVQNLVNEKLGNSKKRIAEMSDEELKNVGYTKEQIKALRELAKQAEETGTPLNELIDNISKPSGRELFIDSFRKALTGLYKSISAVGDAWREVFPKMTSNELYNIIEGIHSFSEHLVISDENADKLRRTFKGVFAILNIFKTLTGGALRIGLKVLSQLLGAVDLNLLDVTAAVGDALVQFRNLILDNNIIIKGLEKLCDVIVIVVKSIKQWIGEMMSLPIVQTSLNKLSKGFSIAMSNIKKRLDDGKELFSDFIEELKSLDNITLDGVLNVVSKFWDRFVGYFSGFGNVFDGAGDAFSNFKMAVKDKLSGVGDVLEKTKTIIGKFVDFVKEKLSGLDIGSVIKVAFGGGVLLLVKKIVDVAESFASPMESISGFFDTLKNAIDDFAKAKAFQTKSKGILNIAIAIGILSAALVMISKIEPDKLMQSALTLLALAGGLLAISIAMGKIDKIGGFTKSAAGMVLLAGSLMILVSALERLNVLNHESIWNSMAVLGVLTTGLITASIIINKASPKIAKGSLAILAMAIALSVMTKALRSIGELNLNSTSNTIFALIGIIGGLAVISKASKGVSLKSSVGLMAIVLSLKMFVGTIEEIANLDLNNIQRNLLSFVAIFGSLALVMASTSLAGKYAVKGGVAMLAISASLLLIIRAVKMVGDLDKSALTKATTTISGLLGVFALMIASTKLAGKHAIRAGAMMLAMSGAFVLLSGVMVVLSKIEPTGLDRAVEAIQKVMLCFTLLLATTKIIENGGKKSIKILSKMVLTISILSIALAGLSMVSPENLKTATNSLTSLMGMFIIMIKTTTMAKKCSTSLPLMVGVVAGLAGILYLLSDLPVNNVIGVASSLSLLMASLSITALIMSKIPVSGAATGVASLAVVIAGIAAIVAACGALSKIDGFNELISDGGSTLMLIGNAIGSFVGGIAGGFIGGASSGLPIMATNLSEFMTNLQPFLDGCKSIDSSTISVVGDLAVAMLAITAAEVLDGLAGLLGFGDMSSFGTKLSTFAKGLVDFSDIVRGKVDAQAVEAAANAGMMVAELANNIPNSGGWLGTIMGENDIDVFGSKLKSLGRGLVDFSSVVKGKIDVASVEAATNSGKMIATLAQEIPNSGGLLGSIMGENDVDTFGSKLKSLGRGLVDFSSVVKGNIDMSAVESATNAGKMITALAQEIPNTGGILGFLVGNNDLDTFGSKLQTFAYGLVGFSTAVSGKIDSSSVEAASNAGKTVVELANNIPNSDGLWNYFKGSNSIDKFGSKLVDFGKSLADYSSVISSIDGNVVSNTTKAAQSIVELANGLPDDGGFFSDKTTLDDFGKMLRSFGTYFSDFNSTISNIEVTRVSGIVEQTSQLVKMVKGMEGVDAKAAERFAIALKTTANSGITEFVRAFEESDTNIATAASSMINSFIESVGTETSRVTEAFKSLCGSIIDVYKSMYTDFTTEGSRVVNCLIVGIQRRYSDMRSAGIYSIKGFVSGIRSNMSSVYQAGRSIGDAAKRGARNSLDVHSPSKEFYRIGDFAGIGFVNALDEYSSKAYKSGTRMADSAKTGLRKTLTGMTSMLNGDIDTQPTIRPVLDLSNVKSGTTELNTLFSRNRALSISTGIGGRIETHNNNTDVVKAINGLQRQINNLSNTTYQINGITYDDGSNISGAVQSLIRATRIERRS